MTGEQINGLKTIIRQHTVREQELQTVKETTELADAIFRFQDKKVGLDKVVDELADVLIMCNQLIIIHQCRETVEQRIDYKIARQIARDRKENNYED